jgi:hypothetical protein
MNNNDEDADEDGDEDGDDEEDEEDVHGAILPRNVILF